jgi:hypothetical protein
VGDRVNAIPDFLVTLVSLLGIVHLLAFFMRIAR